jgi:hypothetical protein
MAFAALLEGTTAARYGIEIDAHRSAQARSFGIEQRAKSQPRCTSSHSSTVNWTR